MWGWLRFAAISISRRKRSGAHRVGQLGMQHLERHRAVMPLVARQVHRRHPAAAECADDAVGTDRLAVGEGGVSGRREGEMSATGVWRKVSDAWCAASRDSTSRRISASPAQAPSRKAARVEGSRSSAAPKICLIRSHRSPVMEMFSPRSARARAAFSSYWFWDISNVGSGGPLVKHGIHSEPICLELPRSFNRGVRICFIEAFGSVDFSWVR